MPRSNYDRACRNSSLPPKFYEINERLGIKANTRVAYRRPWIFISYLGNFEELRGDRHELVKMKIKIRENEIEVFDKKNVNMCSISNENSTNTMPVFPTLGTFEPNFDDNYYIVIPSYNRSGSIIFKTLNFLFYHEIPINKIFIFISDNDEYENYKKVLGDRWKNVTALDEVSSQNGNLIIGRKGIRDQREFIVHFFREKSYIISIDDDVMDVLYQSGADAPLKSLPKGDFEKLIHYGALLMLRTKSFIWSINTSSNPQSMHPTHISRKAGICNGFLYGFFNRHFENILPNLGEAAEDVERSARYFMSDEIGRAHV